MMTSELQAAAAEIEQNTRAEPAAPSSDEVEQMITELSNLASNYAPDVYWECIHGHADDIRAHITALETENARLREENAAMKSGIKWVNPREARRWSNGILRIKEFRRNEKGEEISCDEDDFIPYAIGCFVNSDNGTGTPRLFLCDDGREFYETDPIIHKYAEFPEPLLEENSQLYEKKRTLVRKVVNDEKVSYLPNL